MLYKILTSTLVAPFPGYFIENGTTYTNADAEAKALASGEWHPLRVTTPPTIEDGQIVTKNYHLVGDEIVLDWIVTNTIPSQDAEVTE